MTACSNVPNKDKDQDVTVLTVNDTEINFEQARCYIFLTEAMYENMFAQFQAYGIGGWDSEVEEDGATQAETIKEQIMQSMIADEVTYSEAMKEGKYEVTADEEKTIKENAKKLMDSLSQDTIDKNGFTEEMFVEYQKKVNIVSKYTYDKTKTQEVKREEVEDDIDYENEYKQYKTEYIKYELSKTNKDGSTTKFTETEKKEAKAAMNSVYELVKSGKSLEDAAKAAKDAKYLTRDFTVEELENKAEFCVKASELKVGEYTEILEFNDAYYIIKLIDDDSKDAYEEAIENAMEAKKSEKYADMMDEIKEKEYEIEINEKVWDDVELGDFAIIDDEYDKAYGILVDKSKLDESEQ